MGLPESAPAHSTWYQVKRYRPLASAIVAAVGLVGGVVIYQRQMNAQLFIEYTRRYEQVMNAFPAAYRSFRLNFFGDPPPESDELRSAVLRYLNLCSEEFYLCERGFLSRKIWSIWEGELRRTLQSPLLRREWPHLRTEFAAYSEFADYVDEVQA